MVLTCPKCDSDDLDIVMHDPDVSCKSCGHEFTR